MNFLDRTYVQFNAIAEDLAKSPSRDNEKTQRRICRKHGVNYDSLTDSDCEWIKSLIVSYMR